MEFSKISRNELARPVMGTIFLVNLLAIWDNFRVQFIFGLFYSIYLGPEIKNLEETPYYGRERICFLFGQKRGFSHFVLHIKRGIEARKLRDLPFLLVGGA